MRQPPLLLIRTIKNGAPIMAVSIDTGISAADILRAIVSTIIMNTAPKLTDAGTIER